MGIPFFKTKFVIVNPNLYYILLPKFRGEAHVRKIYWRRLCSGKIFLKTKFCKDHCRSHTTLYTRNFEKFQVCNFFLLISISPNYLKNCNYYFVPIILRVNYKENIRFL